MSQKRFVTLQLLDRSTPPDFDQVVKRHERTAKTFESTILSDEEAPLQSAADFFDATEDKQRKILGIKD
ncbi:hypothetical protein DL93DRAFT_2086584 [Clavulina sp. PMI_390]|nr:hypothetical protein DL93DRAFT_2086584 [Clavulina sp. PMI_390]